MSCETVRLGVCGTERWRGVSSCCRTAPWFISPGKALFGGACSMLVALSGCVSRPAMMDIFLKYVSVATTDIRSFRLA